ncbi:hypothetical protein GUITHDRAFT_158493 [Guillardia theta CCMP2712]|uniref:GDP-Man:Man(3)GlcNAc(2)-PP-Dol alpha-1,2-mannosyltransferase n=1 Tax=Guillardia theta (strain CCMP2712) TaxID=905079 RepID=L1IRY6_GUITC|nr:hypothetical protein GUITHDRAFT_158493 [Guillardia theta CCMP2712]EKX38590.1 hypothetical protein GUITHDRAFT_158493 [Guillardia theta CCMP2712]|eukprot:XP_005825570.1 hypothetical protein GUITHDRAFT_158493 [Guillardia theta CCMP2712]
MAAAAAAAAAAMLSFVVAVLMMMIVLMIAMAILMRSRRKRNVIGFFHPYCNDGGGGERVLWCAIQALLREDSKRLIAVYTGDRASKEEILAKAKERFGFELHGERVQIVYISCRVLLEARMYPVLTLLGQSVGGALLSIECLVRLNPGVFVDTMGGAFTYPVARFLFGCRVGCYVHYPTISCDMLSLVSRREASYNNRRVISNSALLSSLKLLYYKMFALVYGFCGRCAEVTMCNSTWTKGHVQSIWKVLPDIVYPPCNTDKLQGIAFGGREDLVISLGQFRPEKNHLLQLKSIQHLLKLGVRDVHLAIIGSCRNAEDERRVRDLRQHVSDLELSDHVSVLTNVPWPELKDRWLRRAKAGLHTMWNEHFGINIVEFMASGVIPIAHDTGGPKADIVIPYQGSPTGFLASTEEEYAEHMRKASTLPLLLQSLA